MSQNTISHFPIKREIRRPLTRALGWIGRTTGAVLEKTGEGDSLSISGTNFEVEAAEKMLREEISKISVKEVQVEEKKMHCLIGAKGQIVGSIEGETGAFVDKGVLHPGTQSFMVTISGSEKAVSKAEQMVWDLLKNVVVVQVDPRKMKRVIGVRGENSRRISQTTGAFLATCGKEELYPGTQNQFVTISGSEKEVAEAESLIRDQIENMVVKEVLVDAKKVASLIGEKGHNVERIGDQTGASLSTSGKKVFYPGTENQFITIAGSEEEVDKAEEMVLEQMLNIVAREVQVDAKKMASLIGVKGQNRKRIEDQSGAVISSSGKGVFYPGTQDEFVTISGSEKAVKEAEQIILDQLMNIVVEDIQVDTRAINSLVGHKSQNKHRIQSLAGVILVINKDEELSVTISGTRDAVQHGKMLILKQVDIYD